MSSSQPVAWIVDTTDETFQKSVIEASQDRIVVVDFWAEWCAPCRMLGPVLESLAQEYAGKFILAKANTDTNSQAATTFQVAGIPAVFAIFKGDVVDKFEGVMPEPQIRQWLDGLLVKSELAAAQKAMADDPQAAEAGLREILAESPGNAEAQIGLAQLLLDSQRPDEASEIISELETRGFLEAEAERVKAGLCIGSGASIQVEDARAAVAASPKDLALQFKLARGLAAQQAFQEALEICVDIVPLDRKGVGEQARELMVQIFRVLPEGDPLTTDFRRQLSMALY